MKEWNDDWVELSWTVPEGNKIVDGVIKVDLVNNAGFSLQSKTLESKYGIMIFDFKISPVNGLTSLNFISFDENDYVNQGNYLYTGNDYMTIEQEIKNHGKNTFIDSIKRFAWQNYGNEKDYTLYLRRIIYRDIDYIIKKYDKPLPIFDSESCAISKYWDVTSTNKDVISFTRENGNCIMEMTVSYENPAMFELINNKRFTGGKFEVVVKSQQEKALFTWYVLNSNDPNVDEQENDTFTVSKDYKSFVNEDFETTDEYNTIKIAPIMDDKLTYKISDFKFYPITVDESIPLYDITHIEEPDVILDNTGLIWDDDSWGNTYCEFQVINENMECSFKGKKGLWPAFSFKTTNNYDAGTLVIVMKVLEPDKNINILSFDRSENYHNVISIKATTEYDEYRITMPSFENYATYRYAIQEASQSDNTYYIKSIIYYPSYIPIPDKTYTPVPTKTKSKTSTLGKDTPKTEKEIYKENGYGSCSLQTKIIAVDNDGIWGIENNKWCAILSDDINSSSCWSIIYGYQCCSSDAIIEEGAVWGEEKDGTKCGVDKQGICWANELGYDCCSKRDTKIIFIDESGAWGATKDNKWCGII
ncbi:hypothetical protein LY90DRAFT_703292 [Neocallimastix californiae]|jgi:hypothetical protein|uniref:CBM10 domain-containing protein n=1 Tax=Neocallimastix californiae TaxID=1754190 RepID=A0A1Y2CJ92_9FUNG|nr:hypothetical protein LY90DRAFT_703292 [Neocallimastix californiae]|eukprot:ORY47121.1 hypothetical protein LY90DRAFT_703292 [Neocallimastix californiae]